MRVPGAPCADAAPPCRRRAGARQAVGPVVQRRIAARAPRFAAEKAGHTGTLDPLASGLLPVCFGDATKFAQALLDSDKEYVATVRFGIATTTGDAEGTETERGRDDFTRDELERHCPRSPVRSRRCRRVMPRSSITAAITTNTRAKGIEIPRASRSVDVHAIELLDWAPPDAVLRIACSKGTYVRVLAEDIGRALGSCAHLVALRRVATGPFVLAAAVTLDALEAMTPEARDARASAA